MYSPKIQQKYIRPLYRLAKERNIPMTKLVNKIIADYLVKTLARRVFEEDKKNGQFTNHRRSMPASQGQEVRPVSADPQERNSRHKIWKASAIR